MLFRSLHDALPIWDDPRLGGGRDSVRGNGQGSDVLHNRNRRFIEEKVPSWAGGRDRRRAALEQLEERLRRLDLEGEGVAQPLASEEIEVGAGVLLEGKEGVVADNENENENDDSDSDADTNSAASEEIRGDDDLYAGTEGGGAEIRAPTLIEPAGCRPPTPSERQSSAGAATYGMSSGDDTAGHGTTTTPPYGEDYAMMMRAVNIDLKPELQKELLDYRSSSFRNQSRIRNSCNSLENELKGGGVNYLDFINW